MDYHIARNNQKLGVFPEADVRARLQSGEFSPSDLVWCEGMPAWKPAAEVFPGVAPVAPAAAVPPPVLAPSIAPGISPAPRPPKPDNYLVWAILVTLLCCIPFGIVAIIFATQVDSKYAMGDDAGAALAAKRAKIWSIVGACSLLLIVAIYLVAFIFLGAAGVLSSMPH
jgi:hypothetical protein